MCVTIIIQKYFANVLVLPKGVFFFFSYYFVTREQLFYRRSRFDYQMEHTCSENMFLPSRCIGGKSKFMIFPIVGGKKNGNMYSNDGYVRFRFFFFCFRCKLFG